MNKLTRDIAHAQGVEEQDIPVIIELVDTWSKKYNRNILRDKYYNSHVEVKDLGISVSPRLARKLSPKVDWAAKCVDWWADRVQFEGITAEDKEVEKTLRTVMRVNDIKNLMHKVISSSLRHSCAFLTVTAGDTDAGEPDTVISGYPATAASALWDEARKRIKAGLVVVEHMKVGSTTTPKLIYVFTDKNVIVLSRDKTTPWQAEYIPHNMGRVPMEPISYHATLERPFGRSRITRTVMGLVDDAQREMMNMSAAAAFSAAPQKYLLGADKTVAEKLAKTPFEAFIGSVFIATDGRSGKTPQFGQLSQITMQPHIDYMRSLAAQFSGSTGVPLSSLGVVSDNPSSAEAIYAGKEDAVVDIQNFINACKRALENISIMVLAADRNTTFVEALYQVEGIQVNFGNPARPSIVSQSDAMVKQISALPWLAESDVALRELGYTEEQIIQLKSDRRRSGAIQNMKELNSKVSVGSTVQNKVVTDGQ